MSKLVFISHAGADAPAAAAVADCLKGAGIDVRYDRQELNLGDSFLSFMESALSTSDYCLLLWSSQAASTPWVQLEWEAALYRSVQEKRAFLVVGRLEEVNPPSLLSSRLRVDLFPSLQPGIANVIDTWRSDRHAETATQRPVASSTVPDSPGDSTPTVYVTSEAFGITLPIKVDLDAPTGLLLDRVVTGSHLPSLWGDSNFGMKFTYTLMNDKQPLERSKSLAAQNLRDKSILWLKTEMLPIAGSQPIEGDLKATVFREAALDDPPDPDALARRFFMQAVFKARLGP